MSPGNQRISLMGAHLWGKIQSLPAFLVPIFKPKVFLLSLRARVSATNGREVVFLVKKNVNCAEYFRSKIKINPPKKRPQIYIKASMDHQQ
jgi:hypothetical protein